MRLRFSPPESNDNAWETPVVRRPAGRPELAYARTANLILPLRFARRLPEWFLERPKLRPLEAVWRSRAARIARVFNRRFSRSADQRA
jgi:hypothetical protein